MTPSCTGAARARRAALPRAGLAQVHVSHTPDPQEHRERARMPANTSPLTRYLRGAARAQEPASPTSCSRSTAAARLASRLILVHTRTVPAAAAANSRLLAGVVRRGRAPAERSVRGLDGL